MRLLIQRVRSGSVVVDGSSVGTIGCGLVVLVGFGPTDGPADGLPVGPAGGPSGCPADGLPVVRTDSPSGGRADGPANHPAMPHSPAWRCLLDKMLDLRIFPDEAGKMNLGLRQWGGELLLVPQFTLYADCRKGRRPSFTQAAPPHIATALFDQFVAAAREHHPDRVQCGIFGADMDVHLVNWGPVTIWLDSNEFLSREGNGK